MYGIQVSIKDFIIENLFPGLAYLKRRIICE
jgi:hypothetical protein